VFAPAGSRALAWALISALATLVLYLALATVAPPRVLVLPLSEVPAPTDVVYDPIRQALGFHAPEQLPNGVRYRWTNGHATLTFPYASTQGERVTVSARIAAAWAPGQQPVEGTLRVNGHDAATFLAGRDFQDVTAQIDTRLYPDPYLNPTHVQVEILSEAVPLAGDPRILGVAVETVTVTARPEVESLLFAGLIWGAAVGGVTLAAARLGRRWAVAYAALAAATAVVLYLTYTPRAIPAAVEALLAAMCLALAAVLSPRSRPAIGLFLAAVLVWLVVAGRVYGDWEMDDAYISCRYAWNMLEGNGLVYNPGEVVEGYTNFLWTLLAAGAMWAALHPAGVMLGVNIALAAGIVALSWRLATRISGGRLLIPVVVVVLLVADGSLISYGARGSGMEAAAFTFCALLALACLWAERDTKVTPRACAGVALAVASLVRPEGLLVAAVLLGVRAWQDRTLGYRWPRLLFSSLLPLAALCVPYQVWRMVYYGWPFPNTFYAKGGTSVALIERGWDYAKVFLGERWLPAAGAAVAVLSAVLTTRARSGLRPALAAFFMAYALYVVWIGGDYFPGWRFLLPVLPLLVLLGVDGLHLLADRLQHAGSLRLVGLSLLALAGGYYLFTALDLQSPESVLAQDTRLHADYVNFWGSAGLWLRDNTPPGTLTAAKGAGAIAFYSERPVVDMYGLNDLHISHLNVVNMGKGKAGHEKSDPAYVLDRAPKYIFGQWANYFEPLAGRLAAEYYVMEARSPTGAVQEWLVRK
jgi:arabinofuranosyltransferase